MQGWGGTALNRTSASLRGGGQAASLTRPERLVSGCHCEERSDEAIQRTVGSSGTFRSVILVDAHTRAGSPRRLKGLLVMTCAFTMAEILLSLTIIGVVAAITLPSLTGNINERTWNTQRKALYARMSQAVSLMPALNGYGVGATDAETAANATEVFITNGLAKVLKINNICDSEHLADCGLPSKILTMKGQNTAASQLLLSDLDTLDKFNSKFASFSDDAGSPLYSGKILTNAAAFETANGESVLTYYSPSCSDNNRENIVRKGVYVQEFMCANFVYDLNGKKGPNTVGRDIGFMSVLYPSDSVVVAPVPIIHSAVSVPFDEVGSKCREIDAEFRAPNLEELSALFYNKSLLQSSVEWNSDFWSSTRSLRDGNIAGVLLKFNVGVVTTWNASNANLKCIYR